MIIDEELLQHPNVYRLHMRSSPGRAETAHTEHRPQDSSCHGFSCLSISVHTTRHTASFAEAILKKAQYHGKDAPRSSTKAT